MKTDEVSYLYLKKAIRGSVVKVYIERESEV
jgi:hypothetical protein